MSGWYNGPASTLCADFFTGDGYQLLEKYSRRFTFREPVEDWLLYTDFNGRVRFYFERPEDEGRRFVLNLNGVFSGKQRNDFLTYHYGVGTLENGDGVEVVGAGADLVA